MREGAFAYRRVHEGVGGCRRVERVQEGEGWLGGCRRVQEGALDCTMVQEGIRGRGTV